MEFPEEYIDEYLDRKRRQRYRFLWILVMIPVGLLGFRYLRHVETPTPTKPLVLANPTLPMPTPAPLMVAKLDNKRLSKREERKAKIQKHRARRHHKDHKTRMGARRAKHNRQPASVQSGE